MFYQFQSPEKDFEVLEWENYRDISIRVLDVVAGMGDFGYLCGPISRGINDFMRLIVVHSE